MNAKYVAVGAIVGGIVLFLWGAVTHALLPQPLHFFTDEAAVIQTIRINAPENGIYLGPHGIFASVALRADLADKSQHIAPNLLLQFLSDTFSALLLALLIAKLPGGVSSRAGWAAFAGLIAFFLKIFPYWNWYGFAPPFVGQEAFDLIGKFFIGGLLLAFLQAKLAPRSV